MSIKRPFGPRIMAAKLPENIVNKFINLTDKLIADKKRKSWGCALAGQIEDEVLISNEILSKEKVFCNFGGKQSKNYSLYSIINQYLYAYVQNCLKENFGFNDDAHSLNVGISDMWFNEMKAGEYNPVHYHTKCLVSSVLYLKLPKNQPKRNIECKDDKDGDIEFIDRSVAPDFLTACSYSIKPQVGVMYMFPSSLLHTVYPFLGNEVRRSIAWNGIYKMIDKETNQIKLGVR